jgi:hypothetical protein
MHFNWKELMYSLGSAACAYAVLYYAISIGNRTPGAGVLWRNVLNWKTS